MKIHRKKLKDLFEVLNNIHLYEMPISSSFRFMLTSNLQIINAELNQIEFVMKDSQELSDYKNKRIQLLLSLGVMDEETLRNLSEEAKSELEEKMMSLNGEYSDLLAGLDKMESDKKDFMNQEVDLPLKTIHIDKAPDLSKNTANHWGVWNTIKILFHD